MSESESTAKFNAQVTAFGINPSKIYRNLSVEKLVEISVEKNEGMVTSTGSLSVKTGKYTGRSPDDRFIVFDDLTHDKVHWGKVNKQLPTETFEKLSQKMKKFVGGKELFVFDGFVGADPENRLPIRIITDHAWQSLFAHQLFIRPSAAELESHEPELTVMCINDFEAIPEIDGTNSNAFILINLTKKLVLIGATNYAGEIKKSVFSVMNFLLPSRDVFPMHCSSNIGKDGDTALFFGLSGTGKTTLSADPERMLIGDDEHGWSEDGIFNFEGGCYAKAIHLNPEHEPDIYNAIRHGALLENVVYDETTRAVDYDDGSKTENTRVSYPLDYIDNSVFGKGKPAVAGHPETIIFLACDAYGVLPPVAKLSPDQAMYHFISGYTAKVAGTERGVTEPTATFSPCFGGPFLTLHPLKYAALLGDKMKKYNVPAFLVNTGWVGANAKSGAKRISLPITRKIIYAILDGSINDSNMEVDPYFRMMVPQTLGDIDSNLLIPSKAWKDQDEYHTTAIELVKKFQKNFEQYDIGDAEVRNAGPVLDQYKQKMMGNI
jgi:phosphoenolpyruvate carboxykinase (ATP)